MNSNDKMTTKKVIKIRERKKIKKNYNKNPIEIYDLSFEKWNKYVGSNL